MVTTRRHQLMTKCRRRRGRSRVDGDSDHRGVPDKAVATDETYKCLLDPATNATAVTSPCGGVEFYLKVVRQDSAGDRLSPSSVSSVDSELKFVERRQLGDGSTCYDHDLVRATSERQMMATVASLDCELCRCQCSSSSTDAAPMSMNINESSLSNRHSSWMSYGDHRSAAACPAAGNRTIPRCRIAPPPCIRSRVTGSGMTSTAGAPARRPQSWCSCVHVDNRSHDDLCPAAAAEPRCLLRCDNRRGNITTLDSRCRR